MNEAIDKLKSKLNKHGKQVKSKTQVKESEINTAAKQKELLIHIAKDLGYVV